MNINEELNRMPGWRKRRCVYCNRKYPDTILNIEGVIHHHGELRCLDTKSCRNATKKYKKKKKAGK